MATTSDYYIYKLPAYVYLNDSHGGQSPRHKYRGEYATGIYYGRYVAPGVSEVRIPKENLLGPGRKYLGWILEKESEFCHYLYGICLQMIEVAEYFAALNYDDQRLDRITDQAEFYDRYTALFSLVMAFCYPLDFALEEYAQQHALDQSNLPCYGESFINQERREYQNVTTEEQLQEHLWQYSYLLNNYAGFHPVSRAYFTELKSEVEPLPPLRDLSQIPQTLEEWIGFLTYARDQRKRCNMIFNGMLDRYLRSECERLNLVYEDAVLLTPEEFEARKMAGLPHYQGFRIVEGTYHGFQDMSEQAWEALISASDAETIIKGNIASKGKATGTVKVVFSPDQFGKVEQGDILVTSMTRPEFAPILHKVAAIVTDEGGITCHAAIISREMRIPCIISTGNASARLHDGDQVEVDAEKGVVTKLS